MTHPHPLVSKADVSSLNDRYYPWRIEKARYTGTEIGRSQWLTQARNVETGLVIYRCEGWTKASRGQALNAILAARVLP